MERNRKEEKKKMHKELRYFTEKPPGRLRTCLGCSLGVKLFFAVRYVARIVG